MKQTETLKQMAARSREWLEAECLKLAKQTLGGSEIQRVTIRRLRPKGTGPNWKVADVIPRFGGAFLIWPGSLSWVAPEGAPPGALAGPDGLSGKAFPPC
jgi:hypothetical protein